MGVDAYTIRTYYLTLTCDACGHTEEHSHDISDKDNLADNIDQRSEKRKEELHGWHYSYHKIEPVWDTHLRFESPELKEMTRTLLCPTCSQENV